MLSVEATGDEKGWRWHDTKQIISVNGKREDTKFKTECMTWNYPTPSNQETLFNFSEESETVGEENDEF